MRAEAIEEQRIVLSDAQGVINNDGIVYAVGRCSDELPEEAPEGFIGAAKAIAVVQIAELMRRIREGSNDTGVTVASLRADILELVDEGEMDAAAIDFFEGTVAGVKADFGTGK